MEANYVIRQADTNTQRSSKKEIQENLHITSKYADLNSNLKTRQEDIAMLQRPILIHTIEPHLKLLFADMAKTMSKTRQELEACKHFVQTYAANRIQCISRGMLARMHHHASIICFWCMTEYSAAVQLQCLVRTRLAMLNVHERKNRAQLQRRWNTALTLQRLIRGFLSRRHVSRYLQTLDDTKIRHATVRIQCWARCLTAMKIVQRRQIDVHAQRIRATRHVR